MGGVATSALTDLKDWLDDKKDAGIDKAKSLGQYLKERYKQKKQQLEESWKNSRAKEALHNVGDNVKAYLTQANWGKVAGDYLTQFRESMEDYQKKMSEKFFPKLDELVENTKSIPAAAWYSFKSSPMAIEFFDKYYSPLKGWLHEKVENVKKWAMGGPGAMTGIIVNTCTQVFPLKSLVPMYFAGNIPNIKDITTTTDEMIILFNVTSGMLYVSIIEM